MYIAAAGHTENLPAGYPGLFFRGLWPAALGASAPSPPLGHTLLLTFLRSVLAK